MLTSKITIENTGKGISRNEIEFKISPIKTTKSIYRSEIKNEYGT